MAETFSLVPEFEYVETDSYKTRVSEFDSGYKHRLAVWPRPRRTFQLNWNAAFLSEKDYIVSFFRERQGSAEAFFYTPVDLLPAPLQVVIPGILPQITGSYALRTYYYQVTWSTTFGETLPSPEQSFAVPSNSLFTLSLSRLPAGAINAGIYVGTSSGTATLQATIGDNFGLYKELDVTPGSNGLTSGDALPTVSTATETVLVNLAEDGISWSKTSPVSYRIQLIFEENFLGQ